MREKPLPPSSFIPSNRPMFGSYTCVAPMKAVLTPSTTSIEHIPAFKIVEKMLYPGSTARRLGEPMREKVLGWFTWIEENRVRAAWLAVALIALILIVRIVRPF